VVDPGYSKDRQTKAIKEFNDMVAADSRVSVSIVPIRDGLTIIRRNI
jgi:predicted O-methyltransferase YrrM